MIHLPSQSDTLTEWDILDQAAYEHGYRLGIQGKPPLKWRGYHGSHCATAHLAYKKGKATRAAL